MPEQFRAVTVGDAVVAHLGSTACRNLDTRRRRAGTLGLLADRLGVDRPLSDLSSRQLDDALTALAEVTTSLDPADSRRVVHHWLRWCSHTAGWNVPTLDLPPHPVSLHR